MEHVSRHNILSQHAHILQYLAWNCVVCKICLFPKREASELRYRFALIGHQSLLKFHGILFSDFQNTLTDLVNLFCSETQTSTRTMPKRMISCSATSCAPKYLLIETCMCVCANINVYVYMYLSLH